MAWRVRAAWRPAWLMPIATAGARVSARYPFVWRTRMPLWVAIGAGVSALSGAYARAMDVRTGSVPGLAPMLGALSYGMFVVYGALLLMVIDVVRRTGLIVSRRHAVHLFGCVALSAAALLSPQYLFINAALPRIAALETDAGLSDLLTFHGANGFWRCQTGDALSQALAPRRDRIEADLHRYGLRLEAVEGHVYYRTDYGCAGEGRQSLWILDLDTVGIDATVEPDVFEERLKNVAAAKLYLRHAGGAYETQVMTHAWEVVAAAVFCGTLAALLAVTTLVRIRATATVRRRLARRGRRRPLRSWIDDRLAARWPTIWSSRVHASLPALLCAPVLLGVFVAGVGEGSTLWAWAGVPAAVFAMFIALRSQEAVRYLPARFGQEIGVLLIHAMLYGFTAVAVIAVLKPDATGDDLLATWWFMLMACGALQSARNSSAVVTFGGFVLVTVLVFASLLGGVWLSETLGVSVGPKAAGAIGMFAGVLCAGALAGYGARVEARPTMRRVFISSFLVAAPLTGIAGAVAFGPPESATTFFSMTVSIALCLASMVLCLRLTEGSRRALAFSGR